MEPRTPTPRRRRAPPIPKREPESEPELVPESVPDLKQVEPDEDESSIVILNPFWARSPEEQKPRLTVKTPTSPSSPSSPSATGRYSRRPPPPSSIASELLLLSHQLPPDWSDLLSMSMLHSPTTADETTPVNDVNDGSSSTAGSRLKLTSQSSSGSGTRRPLVKQKKHYQSAEDVTAENSNPVHPAVTINVSGSHSPFTCPSLPSGHFGAAPASSCSSLPIVAGRRTCSFEDAVPMAMGMAGLGMAGRGSSSLSAGSSHHLKPSSCVGVRSRSPSPSSAGLRYVSGGGGLLAANFSGVGGGVASADIGRLRANSGLAVGAGSSLGLGSGAGGSGAGGSRQSRQQSVESRASSSIPTGAVGSAPLSGHHHHQPAGSNSSKSGPIEDGAPLPAAFEPVPLNLYGKPLQEIDPTVRDKVNSIRYFSSFLFLYFGLFIIDGYSPSSVRPSSIHRPHVLLSMADQLTVD